MKDNTAIQKAQLFQLRFGYCCVICMKLQKSDSDLKNSNLKPLLDNKHL